MALTSRSEVGEEWQKPDAQGLSSTFEREEVLDGAQSEGVRPTLGMGALERTAFWGWSGDHLV